MFQTLSRRRFLFLLIIFLLVTVAVGISPLTEWFTYRTSIRQWKSAALNRDVPPNSQFEELWHLMAFINCKTCLASTESTVYFSGSLTNNSPEYLVSLNLLTGTVEWQERLQSLQTLSGLDSKYIYISQSATQKIAKQTQLWGAAQIVAFDIDFHNEAWRQRFAGSRGVSINRIFENVLVVDAGPGFYRVDSRTGEKIDGPQQQVLLSTVGKVQYIRAYEAGSILRGVGKETQEVIWTHDLPSFPQFVFEDELVFISNAVSGEVGGGTALDGETGDVLWEYDRVISNIAVSNEIAYFIKLDEGTWGRDFILDAQLLAVSVRTGELLGSLRFEPSGIRSGSGHYEYLVTASNNILLVYLGDSRQLFAFRFSPNEQDRN